MIKFDTPKMINGILCEGYEIKANKSKELRNARTLKLNVIFYPALPEYINLTINLKENNNGK